MDAIHMQNTSINTFIHHGSHLSNDLLIEILLWLPFKSLARFKCVSKAWKTLISDPHFQKRLPTTMTGLLYQQWNISLGEVGYVSVSNQSCRIQSLMDLNLNFCPVYPNLRFMGCTNGLLLLLHGSARPPCPHVYHGNLPPHPDVFYVCNPATRRWAALPECPRAKNWYDCVLIFDPCRSPHFKVIRIGSLTTTTLELTIFYSKTGLWVKSTITTALHRHYLTSRGIVSPDGIIYRLTFTQMLLRINIENESCVEIKLPGKVPPFPHFGICHGNLHCARLREGSHLQVWELKNLDDNEWDLKHSNCIEAVVRQNFEWSEFEAVILLAFHLDIEVIYLGLSNKIISYNFNSEIVEEIYSFSQQHHVSRNLRVHPFKPSFLDCLDDAHHNW